MEDYEAERRKWIGGSGLVPGVTRWRCVVCAARGEWMVHFNGLRPNMDGRPGNICQDCLEYALRIYQAHEEKAVRT